VGSSSSDDESREAYAVDCSESSFVSFHVTLEEHLEGVHSAYMCGCIEQAKKIRYPLTREQLKQIMLILRKSTSPGEVPEEVVIVVVTKAKNGSDDTIVGRVLEVVIKDRGPKTRKVGRDDAPENGVPKVVMVVVHLEVDENQKGEAVGKTDRGQQIPSPRVLSTVETLPSFEQVQIDHDI